MHASATPRWATEPTDRESFAPAVFDVAATLGFSPLPWQQRVLSTALEHTDGQLAYRDVLVTVPRQAGKSAGLMFLVVWRMLAAPDQRIAFGAQSRLAAKSKLLDDWWPVIRRSPVGSMFEVTRATGSESLRCSNGSIMKVTSTEDSAGHGETLDMALIDEAWALEAHVEQALRPAMVTRPNAQLWITSTVGNAKSVWFNSKVDHGRDLVDAGVTSGAAFFEWSADPLADPASPATWRATHPSLGETITEAVFAADFASMPLNEFRRSHLNQRVDDLADAGWNLVDRNTWEAAAL